MTERLKPKCTLCPKSSKEGASIFVYSGKGPEIFRLCKTHYLDFEREGYGRFELKYWEKSEWKDYASIEGIEEYLSPIKFADSLENMAEYNLGWVEVVLDAEL